MTATAPADFCHDHADLIGRLNAPRGPPEEPQGAPPVPALGERGRDLLRTAVAQSAASFQEALAQDPDGARDLRAFLSSPGVLRAKGVWKSAFGAQPPRPVLARVARRAGAQLDAAHGWHLAAFGPPRRHSRVAGGALEHLGNVSGAFSGTSWQLSWRCWASR
eukprot:9503989-Pyramimonas_sp.AAC.2